jgi:integrase
MRKELVRDGWWHLPGAPDPRTGWPGTKNGEDHMVWLSAPARDLVEAHLAPGRRPRPADLMRRIVADLGVERATPHDLRRTCLTIVTRLGFGRDAMDRIANHKEGGVTDVYDRHHYSDENRRVMDAVAAHVLSVAEGRAAADNVVAAEFGRR